MKINKLFDLIIPIIEFFLSIFCIYILYQMENSRYSIFSLFCVFIAFKSFFNILSGILIVLYPRIERLDKQKND